MWSTGLVWGATFEPTTGEKTGQLALLAPKNEGNECLLGTPALLCLFACASTCHLPLPEITFEGKK
jgi:hypothetical protein